MISTQRTKTMATCLFTKNIVLMEETIATVSHYGFLQLPSLSEGGGSPLAFPGLSCSLSLLFSMFLLLKPSLFPIFQDFSHFIFSAVFQQLVYF